MQAATGIDQDMTWYLRLCTAELLVLNPKKGGSTKRYSD